MKLYFIQAGDDGPIKIGISNNPRRRINNIRTSSHAPVKVLGIVNGDQELEFELHGRLARYRTSGEWFSPAPEVIDLVKHIISFMGDVSDEKDAAPEQDDFTKRAAYWAAEISRMMAERLGRSETDIRGEVATAIGLSAGTLETLRRGRLIAITAADDHKIRSAYLRVAQEHVEWLKVDLAQAQAHVAATREILNGVSE